MTKSTLFMWQQLNAGHDINGNPRRLYMLMDINGNIIKVIVDNYSGTPKECKGLVQLPTLNITVKEYRNLKKSFSE